MNRTTGMDRARWSGAVLMVVALLGLAGAVAGTALYEGRFSVREAQAALERGAAC